MRRPCRSGPWAPEGDAGTEDLAAWLRDTGGDAALGGFSSEIDASWLGTIPSSEELVADAPILGGVDAPAATDGPLEAGA